jgi:hypothetical protein
MSEQRRHPVTLYLYDLTQGMAKVLSPPLLPDSSPREKW